MTSVRTLAALGAVVQYAPAVTTVAPLRRWALPSLAGIGQHDHVALTYDDGPDEASTPAFLDLLDRHGVTATFFLLGAHVERHRSVVRDLHARGHELAVHGWDHRCTAVKRPGVLVGSALRPGGTVLLHDTDRTSAPGSWHATLAASQLLLTDWAERGYDVGPLRDHRPF